MLKPKYRIIVAVISAMTLAATAGAQVLIGGFQGAGDPTDAGWVNPHTGNPITTDPTDTFVAAGVTNYAQSLEVNGSGFGAGEVELQFSAAQIASFYTNSWITFTFSVPGGTYTGGYSQIFNLALNAPGYGYNNQAWTNAVEMGNTNNTTPGTDPNYYFNNGANSLRTMVVSLNYSSVEAAIQADISNSVATNGPSYLQMTFQGNNGGGAPTNIFLNQVVLSQAAFGTAPAAVPANEFLVDNFSASGVGPSNAVNDDYFPNAENYADGQITNVWVNYFGPTFVTDSWAQGVSPGYAPTAGSLEVQLNWGASGNFAMWENGAVYGPNISALTYTNFQCDVMFAEGSATDSDGTFGNLQFGTPSASGQDFFGGANNGVEISGTNAGVWQHVSIALNPVIDTNLLNISSVIFHIYPSYTGGNLSGPSTLYIDNVEFVGPTTVAKVPPPVLSVQPAKPGLRMFVGNSATYIREGVITAPGSGESESWVGSGVSYPVNYSFQLLDVPGTNIGVTELAILPEAAFNTTTNFQKTIYNNPFLDYQDSNGLYLTIAPTNHGGPYAAFVQFKVGLASQNPTNTVLVLTTPTAVGTWTLSMSSATQGTVTGPGGAQGTFTITDPNLSLDFANPTVAVIAENPNGTSGYGLYEDIGTISITGTASGTQTENFTTETSDFSNPTNGVSPGGYYVNNYSVDPGNLVIVRNGLDKYWFSWTGDIAGNYALVTATNISIAPANWISPIYYSDYNIPDEVAPRGVGVNHAPNWWELLPADDLPTVDGGFQTNAPTIQDPLSPHAFFLLTTNQANIFPVTP